MLACFNSIHEYYNGRTVPTNQWKELVDTMQFHAGLAHIANAATQFRLGLFLSFYSCIRLSIFLFFFFSFFFTILTDLYQYLSNVVIEPIICMGCDISWWFSSWIMSWYKHAAIKLLYSEDWIMIIMTHWSYEWVGVMSCHVIQCHAIVWND